MERPDQKRLKLYEVDDNSKADKNDLYPKEGEEYPEHAEKDEKDETPDSMKGTIKANRHTQQKVHTMYARSGDLKFSINANRPDLSIQDIREILRHYQGTGHLANHEAVDLAKWFIGDKPRLLSALSKKQIRGVITGGPGSYHVKSEEGKNLGGPYKSREQAKHRLEQVEYFKHKGMNPEEHLDLAHRLRKHTGKPTWTEEPGEEKEEESQERKERRKELREGLQLSAKVVRKQALLDKGMGIFQPAMYRGKEVLLLAIDNTGNSATVEDGSKNQFNVDVADLTPTKTGPYTGKPR